MARAERSSASTQASHELASDLTTRAIGGKTARESLDAASSPPGVQSLDTALQPKPKQRSIFRRSYSTLPRAVWTDNRPAVPPDARRPSTAPSVTARGNCRNSLRISFLAGRKKPASQTNKALEDEPNALQIRPDTRPGPSCNTPKDHFKSGAQYYHHLKKQSISPPFGFEHVTHTVKEQLPSLHATNAADLAANFWANTTTQRPRHSLRGIRADDLTRRRSVVFAHARPASQQVCRRSSLVAHSRRASLNTSGLRKDSSALPLAHYWNVNQHTNPQALQKSPACSPTALPALDDALVQLNSHCLNNTHSQPTHPDTSQRGESAVRSELDSMDGSAVATATDQSHSFPPRALSSQKHHTTQALPPVFEHSVLLEDDAWEDDVDFCYEQEAEATCEFDWETATALQEASPHRGNDKLRDSVWSVPHSSLPYHSLPIAQTGVSSHDFAHQAAHKRGVSVGHRGFLAARSSFADLAAEAAAPPTVQITRDVSDTSPLSTASAAGTTGLPVKSAVHKPNALTLSVLPPSHLDELSDPESTRTGGSKHRKSSSFGSSGSSSARSTKSGSDGNRWSLASLTSVPELLYSHRRNKTSLSKIRISSPLDSPQQPQDLSPLEFENPREGPSVGVPAEHRPHRQSCLHSSPPPPQAHAQQQHQPRQQQPPSPPSSDPCASAPPPVTMRRPQTPGDRAVLQAAGRASQRGRTLTADRHHSPLNVLHQHRETSALGNGPAWI